MHACTHKMMVSNTEISDKIQAHTYIPPDILLYNKDPCPVHGEKTHADYP